MIFIYFKKAGIGALILAGLIAFSRMYLFVHFPTDILGGIVFGFGVAVLVYFGGNKVMALPAVQKLGQKKKAE